MRKKVIAYKEDSLDNLQPNAIVALRVPGETSFSLYVTDLQGIPYSLKENIGEVNSIRNTDGTLDIIGTLDKVINLNPTLLSKINSALQTGDNISELLNDAGYITLLDIPEETDPVFQASEASKFTAGDKDKLDNQSGINTGDQDITGKTDKGGYNGTSKDLDDKINLIQSPDAVIKYGEIALTGLDITINANEFKWRFNQVVFDNALFNNTVVAATDGFYRSDLLQVTNDNIIRIKTGVEDAVSSTTPSPDAGYLPIGSVNVFGATIENSSVISVDYIELVGNGGATDYLEIDKDAVNIIVNSATSITGFNLVDENLYFGKDYYIRNNTAGALTLNASTGTNNVRFYFNGTNLVLPRFNTGHFKLLGNAEFGGIGYLTFVGIITDLSLYEKIVDNDAKLLGKVDKLTGWDLLKDSVKTTYDNAVAWISTNGSDLINHLSRSDNPHNVTKSQVGLSNVDNTSDANKPLSNASTSALGNKENTSNKSNDVADIASTTKFPVWKVITDWVKQYFAPIDTQIEIGANTTVQNSWNGQTILFTTSCTITVPSSLPNSFSFNAITLSGVTVTWAITAPFTWLFGTPINTTEKSYLNFTRRGSTNSIIIGQ